MPKQGKVLAVCLSQKKGETKKPVAAGKLIENFGLEGDAHGGMERRQVSLLCDSSVDRLRPAMREHGRELQPGDFAENLTLSGCEWGELPLGATVRLERGPILEITQIGKECHEGCAIREITGDCVMPREGVFTRVVRGGDVRPGDGFEITTDSD